MVFYPDNEKRASRLQQLVDSIANMQTDVKDIGRKMDEKNEKYRPAINELLKANHVDSVDDVINKAASRMTPEERKAFEALIKAIKQSKSAFEVTYFIAGLLIAPEGVVLTGKLAIAIARWGMRIVNMNNIANFFKATEAGINAATAAMEEISSEAEEAEKTLGEAGEVGEEVGEAMTWLGRLNTFFKVLGAIGLVVTVIVGAIELAQGQKQKEELIEAIHGLQPTRLTIAFYKQEGMNIMQQLELLGVYLDFMRGSLESSAPAIADEIINRINEENGAIDLNGLESDLEAQDRTSSLFYGSDDLSHDEVVAIASAKK